MLNKMSFKKYFLLNEKLIIPSNERNNQIIILGGGAGSGKGFAIRNFIDSNNYKIIDTDELKELFLKLNKLTNKYPELKNLNLRNPKDVFKLHQFISGEGPFKDRPNIFFEKLNTLYKSILLSKPSQKPNLILDITSKSEKNIINKVKPLLEIGYKPENIHFIWVLTNYRIAIKNNENRDRILPEDILFYTHEGAAITIMNIIRRRSKIDEKYINGNFYIIFNSPEFTIFYPKSPNSEKGKVVKDFLYIKIKNKGEKQFLSLKEIDKILARKIEQLIKENPDLKKYLNMNFKKMIQKNIPKTWKTRKFF